MKMSGLKIIGIVLLVVGAVVLILGVINLVDFNSSGVGKFANWAGRQVGSRPEVVRNCIIQICIGAAAAVVGFVLYRRG